MDTWIQAICEYQCLKILSLETPKKNIENYHVCSFVTIQLIWFLVIRTEVAESTQRMPMLGYTLFGRFLS